MKVLRIIIAILLLYVLSYVVLSVCGRYQPLSVGLANVKEYAWAPFAFYDPDHAWPRSYYAEHHPTEKTGGWSTAMMLTFYPLWLIDVGCIHTESRMPPNKSPEPTAVGAGSSAVAVHVASRRWLSFLR
jgi:hypothetical protein